jgi:energy-coupling factor transporter ATP-binding protein EcfA2
MPNKIEKLVLKDFKGAAGSTAIDFDKSKRITLLFGENGTGKSSIIDAIDFVCNENFGSIADRSVGHKQADYIVTLGSTPDKLEVNVTTSVGTWVGKIGRGSKPTVSGPDGRPKARVLRRSTILNIVMAEPGKKYEALRDFIEVPGCNKNEVALRKAIENEVEVYEKAILAVTEARTNLEKLWTLEGKPDAGYLEWANKKTAESKETLSKSLADKKTILDAIASCKNGKTSLDKEQISYDTLMNEQQQAEKDFVASTETMGKEIKDLIKLLEDAQTYLTKGKGQKTCPVCEKPIDPEELRKRLSARLQSMKDNVELKKKLDKAIKAADDQLAVLKAARDSFRNRAAKLADDCFSVGLHEVKELMLDSSSYVQLRDKRESLSPKALEQAEEIWSKVSPIESDLQSSYQAELETSNQLNAMKIHLQTITEKESIARRHKSILEGLRKLQEVVEGTRKDFVRDMLGNIAGTVEDMYKQLHPGEGLGGIKWLLKDQFKASIEMLAHFQGATDVLPQGYYSESHLDTLGVCVFLALAKYYNDDSTIVLLDDVVTSVDQVHMDRFFRMLNEEADNFNQLIIATHYRPWREKYRHYSGMSAKVQLVELQEWSLAKGIRHAKTKFSIEELQDCITATPFDRQAVASKGGILLEAILNRLARQLKCRLPFKNEEDYTLAEYAGGFNKELKKLLRAEHSDGITTTTVDLGPMVEATVDQTWVRNEVGCHFKEPGMDIPDTDVKDFGSKIVTLASSLVCGDCGEFPSRNKSGSYWECKCGRRRLYPLVLPN